MLRSFIRPIMIAATLAGLAAYATIMLRGPQGIRALQERHQQIQLLEEQNANLQRDIESKKEEIERLKHDPSTQQLTIEKLLGKVPEGSTQFKVSGERTAPRLNSDPAANNASQPTH